jgi:hypothetical protein
MPGLLLISLVESFCCSHSLRQFKCIKFTEPLHLHIEIIGLVSSSLLLNKQILQISPSPA